MTWVLDVAVGVGVPLLSLAVGVAAIGAGQDRETLRRQRGIAKALLSDVARIDSALRALQDSRLTSEEFELEAEIPGVHPWVESLIVQIADEAPKVVDDFMKLRESLAVLSAQRTNARALLNRFNTVEALHHRLERQADETFDRGVYDSLHERYTVPEPDQHRISPPDDESALRAWVDAAPEDREARAKLRLAHTRRQAARALADYAILKSAARGSVMALELVLAPLAKGTVPSLPTLILQNIFPVPQDLQDERLLRERHAMLQGSGEGSGRGVTTG